MFPLGVPDDISETTSSTNLIGIDYLSIAIPAFVLSVVWEHVIIFGILPPAHRPLHVARVADSMTSVGLGVLQILFAQVLFLQWFEPLYDAVYDNIRITDAFSDEKNPRNWWLCLFFADFLYYWVRRSVLCCSPPPSPLTPPLPVPPPLPRDLVDVDDARGSPQLGGVQPHYRAAPAGSRLPRSLLHRVQHAGRAHLPLRPLHRPHHLQPAVREGEASETEKSAADRSGQQEGLSGGDPPNPPHGRRGCTDAPN
jgi:hypothetical protein